MSALATLAIAFLLPWVVQPLGRRRPLAGRVLSSLSLYAAFALPLLLWGPRDPRLGVVLGAAGVALLVGLADDRWELPRWCKFVVVAALAWFVADQGIVIDAIKLPFSPTLLPLGVGSALATAVWIVVLTYAVVLCRRLPGLTPGLVGIAAFTFFIVARLQPQAAAGSLTAALALTLAAAGFGYLRYDVPPARLPLGSGAHLFLGFALAATSVLGALKNTAFLVVVLPMLVFGLPLLNTTYAVIFDSRRGRRSFAITPTREFLHETLVRGGLSLRRLLAVYYAAALYLCAVAVLLTLMIKVTFVVKLLLLAVAVLGGLIFFYCVARILSRTIAATGSGKVSLLDIPVSQTDMGEAMRTIEKFIESRSPHMVVTSDSSAIVKAKSDPELREIFEAADLVTPDGAGVVWMAKILGLPLGERVSGVDLVDRICALAAAKGYSVYLLGAAPGIADAAAAKLGERHPGLTVAGTHDGYFTPEEEPAIIAEIKDRRPDILFVALGIPRQEKWIRRHLDGLPVSVAIGVGGSFDVISGRLQRAPVWMQRAGLEWLYRVWREPKRLPRLLALPRFILMGLSEKFLRRR
jgi:N-acetylglucosaminyldiphosphoundecaprenol N-acetyl-beta-D-mannosaminyltransferase